MNLLSCAAISLLLGALPGCLLGFDTSIDPNPSIGGSPADVGDADASDVTTDGVDADNCEDSNGDVGPCDELPVEVCGDCADNDCDGDVDEADCVPGLMFEVVAADELPPGYSVAVTFDHAAWVTDFGAAIDGSELHVWSLGSDGESVAVSRALDPGADFNTTNTTLWIALPQPLSASARSAPFLVSLDAGSTPLDDENQVFHFADYFNRPNTPVIDNGWTVDGGPANVELADGKMFFDGSADGNNRPSVDHFFSPLSAGLISWQFDMDFDRFLDQDYRLVMQLGQASSLESPPNENNEVPNVGVGPNLVWAGPNQGLDDQQGLGHEENGSLTQHTTVTDTATIEVRVDLSASPASYDLLVDGTLHAEELAFTGTVAQLDTVRFVAWDISQGIRNRTIDNLIVRPMVENEPSIALIDIGASCN